MQPSLVSEVGVFTQVLEVKITLLERKYPSEDAPFVVCAPSLDLIIHFLLQHYQTWSASLLSCFGTFGKAACLSLLDLSFLHVCQDFLPQIHLKTCLHASANDSGLCFRYYSKEY